MKNKTGNLNRRDFFKKGVAFSAAACLTIGGKSEGQTSSWNPESIFPSYKDEVTGVKVFNLTPGGFDSEVIYQTHPMWTRDMQYLMFYSTRDQKGKRPWIMDIKSGEARPLSDKAGASGTMTWKNDDLYYIVDRHIFAVDVVKAFHGQEEPRCVGQMPASCLDISGTVTVDADLSTFYFGGTIREEKVWGLFALDINRGNCRTMAETDFKVGHLQANPVVPGSVMFCQETGGDAPQRIWHITREHPHPEPLYKETYGEWVTHEVWWGAERILFTIWPYDDERKNKPHGVASADILTGPKGEMTILAQYPAWHTHGSPDKKWAVGDDFDRNLWLINIPAGERKLLTQGHKGADRKTHPHCSFTPDSRGIIFNSSRNGTGEIFYVSLPNWENLP